MTSLPQSELEPVRNKRGATSETMKTILLTGANGVVGRFLRSELAGQYFLCLSDRVDVIDCSSNERSAPADLLDLDALRRAVDGVDSIVHLGAYSVEGDWETIRNANISGTYNLYEVAREAGVKRIVFASSNHAVGFYPRSTTIDEACVPKPDSRYGLSKVFGEALASLYADKYSISSMCIRIGNVAEKPQDYRRLSIWISPRDLAQLVTIGLEHPLIHFEIVYGMSLNDRAWWDNTNAYRLGYKPKDRSEAFAEEVIRMAPRETGDPRADHYQGGSFVSTEVGGDPYKPNHAE